MNDNEAQENSELSPRAQQPSPRPSPTTGTDDSTSSSVEPDGESQGSKRIVSRIIKMSELPSEDEVRVSVPYRRQEDASSGDSSEQPNGS
jgi:hypothetical protein